MLWQHKRTGDLYRSIMKSFSTERQRPSMVYINMNTGQVFDRDLEVFENNFELLVFPQNTIVPKEPHPVSQ